LRLAAAKSLERIERRAGELGLRPLTREQSRYITVPPTADQPQAAER
jgi:hypothetical protein